MNPLRKNEKIIMWMESHAIPDSTIMLLTASIVGVAAGFGAVGFRNLIGFIQKLSFQHLASALSSIAPFHLLIIPAIGGAIFGPIIYKFAREAKGHGVPEVMEAVALRGGRIRPQVVFVKALASALCIGTGGSVGREGPIAQIGSAIGSWIGQIFNLSEDRMRTLVACGAAGGISATFNAPIGGALFAMEVILGKLHISNFVPVVISAVIADVIGQAFEGNVRAFNVPSYSMGHPSELLFYAMLGVAAAVAAVIFTRFLYLSEDLWDSVRIPDYVKPVIGGVLLGALGIVSYKSGGIPRIFGVGYESITEALNASLPLQIAFGLLVLKILATSITIGSGGSGGIFAPSLYMGAMLGLGFGYLSKMVFPGLTASPGAFAMVGMAAFFSGAAHTPVTSILILFEMTNDYNIILPLMFATVISTLVSTMISRDSIYTLKLIRRGVRLEQGQDIDVMQGIFVHEVMNANYQTVPGNMPLNALSDLFSKSHHNGFPVVDENGNLRGVVTASDLDEQASKGEIKNKKVVDICTTNNLLIALPSDPIWKSLKRMSALDIGLVPVVESEETRQVIGVVRRNDIIRAYNHAIAKRANLQHKNEMFKLGKLDSTTVLHIELSPQSPYLGSPIKNIPLPADCLIISVRRKNRKNLIIAHGNTILQPGDRVAVFVEKGSMADIESILNPVGQFVMSPDVHATRHQEFVVSAGSTVTNKRIDHADLPINLVLVNIHRGTEVLIPHGSTVIKAGDVIEVFGRDKDLLEAEQLFAPQN